MEKTNKKGLNIYIILGLVLIASALAFVFYNMWDEARAGREVASALEDVKNSQGKPGDQSEDPEEREIPDYQLNENMNMPSLFIDGLAYVGTIKIPSLTLELPVLDGWDYEKMKLGPCTYSGTAYKNDLIILAHNYNSHFGSLDKLDPDDKVFFTDMDGNQFEYKVVEKVALKDTQVEDMQTGDWDLTLFTCSLNRSLRITIRCEKVEEKK